MSEKFVTRDELRTELKDVRENIEEIMTGIKGVKKEVREAGEKIGKRLDDHEKMHKATLDLLKKDVSTQSRIIDYLKKNTGSR